MKFRNEEERRDFENLIQGLEADLSPVGILERELVREIAVCFWKIAMADAWLMEDISARRAAAAAVLDSFINSSKTEGNPFSEQKDDVRSAARAGCDLRELIVRVGAEDAPGQDLGVFSPDKTSRMQFMARLGGSGDTIFRYQSAWKRDLHRAIDTLRKLQQARKSPAKLE